MKPRRSWIAALCLLAALAGCDETPTSVGRNSSPQLLVYCIPEGVRLGCDATLHDPTGDGSRDVTAAATWLVSDPALGEFLEPGIFTPRQRGEVALSARYQGFEPPLLLRFLVDPAQPPRSVEFLAGDVRNEVTLAPLPDAVVEILDGYARGGRSVTNEVGRYTIERVLTGETFSVTVSKSGYAPATVTYRIDPSTYRAAPGDTTPRNSPWLDFRLRRLD